MISFPSNFDPTQEVSGARAGLRRAGVGEQHVERTFQTPNPLTEYGFIVLNLDSRATPGMGKRTLDAIYLKLGQVEMDDMAEGVKALWNRPYVDKKRVGIFGTSYGGYTSVDGDPAPSRCVRGRVVVVAADRLAQLRHDLHRAVHVDSAGEQGGLRRRLGDDVRRRAEGPADALLRHGGQQRAPVEHDAAHLGAAARRQELRRAGRARPGALAASISSA